jgi:hypothetical protein
MRYAVIDSNNYVVNIVLWDGVSEWSPGPGLSLIQIQEEQFVDIGWTYDEETGLFINPILPVGIGTT